MSIESVNPATGRAIARYESTPAGALPGILERARGLPALEAGTSKRWSRIRWCAASA